MNNDTIFALSSGHGKSGVAVIRISGDNLRDMFRKISGRNEFSARTAYFTNMCDTSGELIDQIIAIYFATPASFTGEDVIEIHSHGAPAVIEKIFKYLAEIFNARMATPGEFSRRAFYNNKMDLADVDGLAALLDATTDKQRAYALKSLTGHDSQIYNTWRTQMIEISAYSAAILDYSPDDLPKDIGTIIKQRTKKLLKEIDTALSCYHTTRAIRNGFNITLIGEPNVGKSSIFNYLAGESRAIVSEIPGTTRDVVSIQLDIDGYLVNLSDTAGLRNETTDEIEKIGIEKSKETAEKADLILHVYTDDKVKVISKPNIINIINKCDLLTDMSQKNLIYTSVKSGIGLDKLSSAIKTYMHKILDNNETGLCINTRTYQMLKTARDELENALNKSAENYDIFSEHTRRAGDAIGKILGQITTADVLDTTFGQLCLGK